MQSYCLKVQMHSFWFFVKEIAANKGSKELRGWSQKIYAYQNFNYKENI